ncbi:hypothetical protein QFC20_007622 [Naganishia adeliensis]|uniref:Uncharacterized protein n=1 Tax=Naganishia adeliensis TaxID=92952 RepID=A0ACC2UXI2_9TREE|nr:hypothetical protein QFC20_007622 [Naganishia adeliensis]
MTMTSNSTKNTTMRHDGPVTKVGINGFGRIGRSVLRVGLARSDIKVVAINHTAPTPEALLLALQYDSTHGRNPYFDELSIVDDPSTGAKFLAFAGDRIVLSSERDPTKLTWDAWGAEYVLECTGKLTTIDAARVHISVGGAKKVIISAPSKDAKTFVFGVNHGDYSSEMDVVSNASCTTNCLAPIAKVLDKVWGIEAGMLTTVHASTASQHLLDGFSKKNLRLGRSVANNIIPTSTGAASAVKLVLPQLEGKFHGMSVRVPVSNVSMIDLTVTLSRPCSTLPTLLDALRAASKTPELRGVVHVCEKELVSSDFLGRTETAIVDANACFLLNERMAKVVAWYDNETAYSSKALDMARWMHVVDGQ